MVHCGIDPRLTQRQRRGAPCVGVGADRCSRTGGDGHCPPDSSACQQRAACASQRRGVISRQRAAGIGFGGQRNHFARINRDGCSRTVGGRSCAKSRSVDTARCRRRRGMPSAAIGTPCLGKRKLLATSRVGVGADDVGFAGGNRQAVGKVGIGCPRARNCAGIGADIAADQCLGEGQRFPDNCRGRRRIGIQLIGCASVRCQRIYNRRGS